jgi:eukaryotic-like serine/threonine-protein kinase
MRTPPATRRIRSDCWREGRAASALTHPNILRVYDAAVEGASYYLVSEWLEGKSLRDELSRGPLALKRFLDVAVQIADGLAAAHAIGIVHRDIKPDNVMLAGDGTARIVDFGLARIDPHAPSRAATVAHATTVTLDNGLSGTPAYMSPEQARGQLGDFRTDQFSFGALMYEMATGKCAFRRDTMADTLSAVLRDEPKPVVIVNPRVPTAVAWIIEQCLAKEAGDRYSATDDLARELRRVRERLRETAAEPQPRRQRTVRASMAAAAGATAVLVIGAATIPFDRQPPELKFTPIASAAEYEGTPIWSPDGQSLAWVANVDGILQIFVRRLADAVATQVTRGRFDAEEPFWAPDSRALYFISAAGEGQALWTISSAGGRAELLLENVNHAAIDPSGRRFALVRSDTTMHQQLWWASAAGSDLVREQRGQFGERGFGLGGQLRFRPDGRELLIWIFNDRQAREDTSSAYYLVPTADGPIRQVLQSVPSTANLPPVSWLPDNRHVVVGMADPGGTRHLWIADTQSDVTYRLTSTHTNETWPAASPDGRRIAYASEEVDFDLLAVASDTCVSGQSEAINSDFETAFGARASSSNRKSSVFGATWISSPPRWTIRRPPSITN